MMSLGIRACKTENFLITQFSNENKLGKIIKNFKRTFLRFLTMIYALHLLALVKFMVDFLR